MSRTFAEHCLRAALPKIASLACAGDFAKLLQGCVFGDKFRRGMELLRTAHHNSFYAGYATGAVQNLTIAMDRSPRCATMA